jgi:aspartate racemase
MKPGTIGIIGGMGSAATVDLFRKIVELTPAENDQDHLRIVIDNNPRIPDRLQAVFHAGEDPIPSIIKMARNLQSIGADFLIMPCNTAHVFLERLKAELDIPFLSIIECSAKHIRQSYPEVTKVGLLGTDVTIYTGAHREIFSKHDLEIIIPEKLTQQNCVTKSIYGSESLKAGNMAIPRQLLTQASNELISLGAEVILMGCTELPLAMHQEDISVPIIDANAILAQTAIDYALGKPR